VRTVYQQGEHAAVQFTLAKGGSVEKVTIVYRTKDELPELERIAKERLKAWE